MQILLGGFIHTFIQPNMELLIQDVQQGTLDNVLTNPEDLQRHIPGAGCFRRHGSGGSADVEAPLADARSLGRLRSRAVRIHALVLAPRPTQLLGRLGLA